MKIRHSNNGTVVTVVVGLIASLAAVGACSPSAAQPSTTQAAAAPTGTSSGATTAQASVPEELRVPETEREATRVNAEGDQVYECKGDAGATGFEWKLRGPDAKLFANGQPFGKHYDGPTWEAADGSKIVADVVRKSKQDPHSVPWLLLKVKSSSGTGTLGHTSYIQRVNTHGGVPTGTCDQTNVGATQRSAYSATYIFYAPAAQ